MHKDDTASGSLTKRYIVPDHSRQRIAQVGVDVETGQVFLDKILSAHDVAEI